MSETIWELELLPHTNKRGKLDEMVLVTDISHTFVHHYIGLIHIDSFGRDVGSRLSNGEAVQVRIEMVNEEG